MPDDPSDDTHEPLPAAERALLASRLGGELSAAIATLEAAPDLMAFLPEDELTSVFGQLMRLRAMAEGAALATLIDAETRGVVRDSDHANAAAWVGAGAAASGAPVTPHEAFAFARVAKDADEASFARLLDHTKRGRIGVREAAPALREFRAMRMSLVPELWDEATDVLVDYLATGASARQVAEAHDAIVASYGREGELDERQRVQRNLRSMGDFRRDRTGMYVSALRLDPESHAALEAVLSAHSRPRPDPDGTPDPRDRPMRRADTLIELVTQVGTTPGSLPDERPGSAGRAELIVTISAQDLARATGTAATPPEAGTAGTAGTETNIADDGTRGADPGVALGVTPRRSRGGWGTTESGQVFGASIISRLACSARFTPVLVAGVGAGAGGAGVEGAGHVLDVGRRFRFATQRQLAALHIRDKGCTFPGCDRPPSWCDAHHIVHWCHGGRTDLDNLALLCERHHSVVHSRGYTATVTPDGVQWDVPTGRRSLRRSASPASMADSILPKSEPGRHPQLVAQSVDEALDWLRSTLREPDGGIPPTIVLPYELAAGHG